MRLHELEIRSFRCYEELKIDLSADVTVIYGRNGTGKTSLFDAIELALMGAVFRIGVAPKDATQVLARVGSKTDPMVRLRFGHSGENHVSVDWNRSGGRLRVESNLRGAGNHHGLVFKHLIDREFSPGRNELEQARILFASSIALSQSNLRRFVEGGRKDRMAVLSDLAGVPDTRRRHSKIESVLEFAESRSMTLKNKLAEAGDRLESSEEELGLERSRLEVLRETIGEKAISIAELNEVLAAAGMRALVVPPPPSSGLASLVREMGEERLADIAAQLSLFAELEEEMASYRETQQAFDREKRGSDTLREEVANLEARAQRAPLMQVRVAATLDEARERREREEILASQLRELIDRQKRVQRLRDLSGQLDRRRVLLRGRVAQSSKELAAADDKKAVRTQEIEQLRARLAKCQSTLGKAISLLSVLQQHSEESSQVSQARARGGTLKAREGRVKKAATRIQNEHEVLKAKQRELREKLKEEREASSNLSQLLARLASVASGGVCPLCGHDHQEQSSLRESIRTTVDSRTTQLNLLERHSHTLVEEEGRLVRRLSRSRELLGRVRAKASAVRGLLEAQTGRAGEMLLAAQELGCAADTESAGGLVASERESEQRILGDIAQQETALSAVLMARRTVEEQERRREGSLTYVRNHLDTVNNELTASESDRAELRDSLGTLLKENGEAELADCLDRIDKVDRRLHVLASRQRRLDALGIELKAGRDRREDDLSAAASRLDVQSNVLRSYEARWRSAGLDIPVDSTTLSNRTAAFEHQIQEVRDAIESARAFEMAQRHAESLSSSARLAVECQEATQDVADIRGKVADLEKAMKKLSIWEKQLAISLQSAVDCRIGGLQDQINALFRAMVAFPERFERIDVQNWRSGRGVDLGLLYSDAQTDCGEPRFFLSSAELNVLALSIFIAFATTQNWFKIRTLLLDDPVQQLDDLDAAAFLDTIRAIATGSAWGARQVLFSTCNRELYRLVLRKFSLLNEAKEGAFTAVSLTDASDGPRVHYDVGGPAGASLLQVHS